MLPRIRADSPQTSFASFLPLRIDSPTLEEWINGTWRHEIWIRNAGGVGRWAGVRLDAFSRPSAPWDPRILLGLDLINHQHRHATPTGICPTACSVIFLKASAEKYIPVASRSWPSCCQEKMPLMKVKRGMGGEGATQGPKVLKC